MKIYRFHSDSGHGWLAVKREELAELGLLGRISPYSYVKGDSVYLEEDCDAPLFMEALSAKGLKRGEDFDLVYLRCERSPIRGYARFYAEEV